MIGRGVLAAVLAVLVSACGQADSRAEKTDAAVGYPITVANCGRAVVIDAPPQRAVSLNQGSTEILLSLGLADRMVGTATWTDPVRENLAEANATVPQLAVNKPSLESVLDTEPDFVSASFAGTLGPGGVADRDQFASLGVPTYLAPSDCVGKVSVNADGARTEPFTMDAIYGEIRDLARIFDVAERGEELIDGLDQRMQASRVEADADLGYWFSDIRAPYFGGCCGSPGVITDTVGARNIFVDTTEEWPQVSWEVIADRDPDALVLADLSRRTIDGDALAAKIAFLESNPVTARMTAVQEKRYIVVNGADLNPSIRTVDGAAKVADGLRRFGLTAGR